MKCPVCNKVLEDQSNFCNVCGYSFSSDSQTGQLDKYTVLDDRYIIVKTLGRGGMGAVYLALDQRLNNRSVAIKEMSTKAIGGDLQAAIAAFKKEASMLINLRHQALPVVHDFFAKGEDRWYLVMDYIEGQTLDEVARSRGSILEAEVLDWACQLCEILGYLHKQNPPIIFRDLKPANIMLTPEGQIKLIDFGIARHFRVGITSDTTAYGSHGFAPPEQYGENQTSPASDIYALGATLHYLLTGIDPGKNPFIFEAPSKTVKVSAGLDNAIMKALELKTEDRPRSMMDVMALLPGESDKTIDKGKESKTVLNSKDSSTPRTSATLEKKTTPIKIQNGVQAAPMNTMVETKNIGVENDSLHDDFDKTAPIALNGLHHSVTELVSSGGSAAQKYNDAVVMKPARSPNKAKNIIIAVCLLIVLISGGAYAYKLNTKIDQTDDELANTLREFYQAYCKHDVKKQAHYWAVTPLCYDNVKRKEVFEMTSKEREQLVANSFGQDGPDINLPVGMKLRILNSWYSPEKYIAVVYLELRSSDDSKVAVKDAVLLRERGTWKIAGFDHTISDRQKYLDSQERDLEESGIINIISTSTNGQ